MTEMWLPIVGFGRFEVSDQGRIRRLAYTITKKSRGGGQHQRTFLQTFLAMQTHTNGYLTVRLHPSKTSRMVSRLVCEAFNGPPPSPEYHADHINGVRDDNRATNLRWLSPAANRAKRNFASCEVHGSAKLNAELVRMIRAEWRDSIERPLEFDRRWAADSGVSRESVRNVRLQTTWKEV